MAQIDFEQVLMKSLDPRDANSKKKADEIIMGAKKSAPGNFMVSLVSILLNGSNDGAKNMAGVLLRQLVQPRSLDPNAPDVFDSLPLEHQTQVKQALIQSLTRANHSRPVNSSIAEAVGVLGSKLLPNGKWPELLPSLIEITKSDNPLHKEAFLKVLNNLAEYAMNTLKPELQGLKKILQAMLNDNDSHVKRAAFEATVSVIAELEDGAELNLFKDLLPIYFQRLGEAAQAGDEDLMKTVLTTLRQVAELKWGFFRDALHEMTNLITQICQADALDWDIRRLGVEIMVQLTEKGGAMCRKNDKFCQTVVSSVMEFLRLYDDDLDFNNAADDDEQENLFFGQGGVQTLAAGLGGEKFMKIAFPLIQQWSNSDSWKDRYAAINALVFSLPNVNHLVDPKDILQMAIKGLQDKQDQVCFTSFDLFKMLLEQNIDKVQETYTGEYFQAILSGLKQRQGCWRIQQQCARLTILTVSENRPELFAQYSEEVLSYYRQILQNFNLQAVQSTDAFPDQKIVLHPMVILQEDVLIAVAAMAETMGVNFQKFYPHFVPIFKDQLKSLMAEPRLTGLQGKCVDALGICGLAVGREMFLEDATNLMNQLLPNYGNYDDDLAPCVMAFFGRISKTIGEDFAPCLEKVMPDLIKTAQQQGGNLYKVGDETPDDPTLLQIQVHLRGSGDYILVLNPAIMEKQATALQCIYEYATEVPVGFFKFIGPTVAAIKPLFNYAYDPNIRPLSVGIMTPLIRSCKENVKINRASVDDVKCLFNELFAPFMGALKMERKVEDKDATLDVINETLEAYGIPLTQEQQVEMAKLLGVLLDEMIERRAEYEKMKNDPDYDETMHQEYEAYIEQEDKFLQEITLCNKRIAQLCGGGYVQVFEEILSNRMKLLLTRSVGEICWALAAFDDLIEVAKPQAVTQYAEFLQKTMLHFKDTKDEWITQNVAYAVHVLSEAGALQNVVQWAQWLTEQMTNPNGRGVASIENCTSALGVMLITNGNSLDPKEVLPFWLSHLPIREDEEEVETSVKALITLAKSHPSIVQSQIPKVQEILLCGLGGGCLTSQTAPVAIEMLSSVTSDEQLQGLLQQMPEHEAMIAMKLIAAVRGGSSTEI